MSEQLIWCCIQLAFGVFLIAWAVRDIVEARKQAKENTVVAQVIRGIEELTADIKDLPPDTPLMEGLEAKGYRVTKFRE